MNARKLGIIVIASCAAALLASLGCQQSSSVEEPTAMTRDTVTDNPLTMKAGEHPTLVPTSRPPVRDLPVPIGFRMREQISRDYKVAGARVIDHVFRGPAAQIAVEQFYRYHMPLNGWTYRGQRMISGIDMFRFEKGEEWCELSVDTIDIGFGRYETEIHIQVQTLEPRQASAN